MSHAPSRSGSEPSVSQDVSAPAASTTGARRVRAALPASQRLARFAGDWIGISVLFCLWISMLLLLTHIVIIPRTCAQRWPAWVPLLGDIPFLGALFRNKTRTANKTELLVFLTPKVITDRNAVTR